jgi:hypothetical protein
MMKRKIWTNKSSSFKEAERFENSYYSGMSGTERVEAVQLLREAHFRSAGLNLDENGKRLRRVIRVVEQT